MDVQQMTPFELKKLLDENNCAVLDVREPEELEIADLPRSPATPFLNIPLMQLSASVADVESLIERSGRLVCICRSGQRSQMAAEFLSEILPSTPGEGVPSEFGKRSARIANLDGGILAFAEDIDSRIQKY